ncbi:hypothetical protein [Erythrobacter alti]
MSSPLAAHIRIRDRGFKLFPVAGEHFREASVHIALLRVRA